MTQAVPGPSEASIPSAVPPAFLRLLAHELRNYLAPIQNAMHLLRLRARSDPALLPVVEIIERQAVGMLRTLEAVGEAERASRGELALERAPTEVASLVSRAVEAARPVLDARHVALALDDFSGLPTVDIDAARIARALGNVLDNAARYAPEGSRVAVRGRAVPGAVELTVADQGSGFPPGEPTVPDFFRAPHRAGHGLGLGLPLARALLALHGGALSIGRGADGKSTEVILRLPVGAPAPAQQAAPAARTVTEPTAHEAGSSPGRRVLIADDSAAIRTSLGELLQDLGHEVRAAADGAEALALAQSWHPEFVLLDIHMPNLNGFEAARRLRALYPPSVMQLVLISGDDLDDTIRRGARAAGFDHCIDKGLAIGELTELLARGGSA